MIELISENLIKTITTVMNKINQKYKGLTNDEIYFFSVEDDFCTRFDLVGSTIDVCNAKVDLLTIKLSDAYIDKLEEADIKMIVDNNMILEVPNGKLNRDKSPKFDTFLKLDWMKFAVNGKEFYNFMKSYKTSIKSIKVENDTIKLTAFDSEINRDIVFSTLDYADTKQSFYAKYYEGIEIFSKHIHDKNLISKFSFPINLLDLMSSDGVQDIYFSKETGEVTIKNRGEPSLGFTSENSFRITLGKKHLPLISRSDNLEIFFFNYQPSENIFICLMTNDESEVCFFQSMYLFINCHN